MAFLTLAGFYSHVRNSADLDKEPFELRYAYVFISNNTFHRNASDVVLVGTLRRALVSANELDVASSDHDIHFG